MPSTLAPESSPASATLRAASFSPLRTAFLLFLFLNCVYLLTSTGRARSIDEIDPVLQSESLLLHHTTAIPQALNSGIYFGKIDRHGVPRSAWPAGHALMVLPWSAVGHSLFARLPGMPRGISDLAIITADCWSSATWASLAVAAAFLLFVEIAGRPRIALACALLVAFATPLFVYSGWLFSEAGTTALFMMAALSLFATGEQVPVWRAVIGSLLLGFSIHVRPANLVTVAVFIAASLALRSTPSSPPSGSRFPRRTFPQRTTAILVAVVGISGLIYLARNYVYFGNPFDFGVPATAENGKNLNSWHNPFWVGIAGFLFSPGKSALLFCPPVLLGILGLPHLWRRNRALTLLVAAAPLAALTFFAFYTQWEGGYCYGARFLVPSLTLLCLPIAALLSDAPLWLRPAFWIAAIGGFFVQAVGLSTNIQEDMHRNHYYVGNYDYRMGYSAITGQLQLIWKYLHVAPSSPGLGWDRWFVLLRAFGASPSLLGGIAALFIAGALVFGLLTWREFRNAS